ncbi:MAG: DegT/DnrJ/EryC1/StrS family aminotransferase [Candidatus Brocadiae bacterium]|nr:DegT/DnrJ/EryC1/StrS family aminotransferase [Candidatus Brocadiia bacterium]
MPPLAIDGGPPVRTAPFPPRQPFGDREIELVTQALRSQNLFGPSGTMVPELERRFADTYGVRHAVASTSGTAAIHVAIGALNPDPGDEIIVPPITDAGSVLPILFQQAVPVFPEVDETHNLDPASVEAAITPRTRAILAVHLSGNPCHLDALCDIARRHGIALIEDCSQAHLTRYHDRICGTLGRIGCFSFQQSKHMTTGDGGMTITDDDELADRMSRFRDKGWTRKPGARRYPFLGLNYRMTELQGAVGLAQLEKLPAVVQARHDLGEQLSAAIADVPGILPSPVTPGGWHTYWHYGLRVVEGDAARFAEALRAEGIPCGHGYIGKPIFLCMESLAERTTFGSSSHPLDGCHGGRQIAYDDQLCPRTHHLLQQMLVLTIHEHFAPADVADMATAIRKVAEALIP